MLPDNACMFSYFIYYIYSLHCLCTHLLHCLMYIQGINLALKKIGQILGCESRQEFLASTYIYYTIFFCFSFFSVNKPVAYIVVFDVINGMKVLLWLFKYQTSTTDSMQLLKIQKFYHMILNYELNVCVYLYIYKLNKQY